MTQTLKTPGQYRMTLEDVYRDYSDGHLTAKGAVFAAIAATCEFGKAVNFNVSNFLERTGMHQGSYTRAVKTLMDDGRLDLPPNAVQSLRVPISRESKKPLYYSLVASRSQICDRGEQICDRGEQICDRGEQICDRGEQICDRQPLEPLPVAESESPSTSLLSLPLSLSTGERDGEAIEDEYEEWLTKKAQELPTPPTFLEEWLLKNRNKKSNRKEFFKYKKIRERADVPQPAAPAIFEVESEAERRLSLLQFWWEDGATEKVKATIANHPEWRLHVTTRGIEVLEDGL